MSLIETSSTATHKTEHRKPKPVAAPATHQEFEWGAEAIGRVINRNEKQVYHLYYSGALDGAVRKVRGQLVGHVPSLIALLTGK